MSKLVRSGARKLPTMLGGGILGVAAVSLALATAGISLPLSGELLSAFIGAVIASRYS